MAEAPSCLTIREVADRSGCSPSTLRYYEAEGLIAALPRRETATRTYSPQVLNALEIITALRGAGFGIGEIKNFLAIKQPGDPVPVRLEKAARALGDLSAALQERRRALDRAEALLRRWQTEVKEAQLASHPPE